MGGQSKFIGTATATLMALNPLNTLSDQCTATEAIDSLRHGDLLHTGKTHKLDNRITQIDSIFDYEEATRYEYLKILPEYQKLKGKIISLQEYEDGWDGAEAVAPLNSTIDNSLVILKVLESENIKHTKIMLSSNGEISFFWSKPGFYSVLTIEEGDIFSFVVESETHLFDLEEQKIPETFDELNHQIRVQLKSV